MSRRTLILGAAAATCLAFAILRLREFVYLFRGYDIGFSIIRGVPGGPILPAINHIDFPVWRQAAQAATSLLAFIATGLLWRRRTSASVVAWLAAGSVLCVGGYDVIEFGTLASPTSPWSVLAILALALLVRAGSTSDAPLRSKS